MLFTDAKDQKSVQISIATSSQYVEIIVGVVLTVLALLVIGFYSYKKCFRPDLATPRPIRIIRQNLTERFGLRSLFTPNRQDHANNLNDAILLNESYTGSNDVSPA